MRCREDEGCVLSLDWNQEGPLKDLQIEGTTKRTALSIKEAAFNGKPLEAAAETASVLTFQRFSKGEAYGWARVENEAGAKQIGAGQYHVLGMNDDVSTNKWLVVQEVNCENGSNVHALAVEATGDGFYDYREVTVEGKGTLPPENFTSEFPFLQDKPINRYDALPGGRVLYADWIADLPGTDSDFRTTVCDKVAAAQTAL